MFTNFGRFIGKNIYKRKIKNYQLLHENDITGLRINNLRGIRSRFPDHYPETAMQYSSKSVWILNPTTFIKPKQYDYNYKIYNVTSFPDVYWPMESITNCTKKNYGIGTS